LRHNSNTGIDDPNPWKKRAALLIPEVSDGFKWWRHQMTNRQHIFSFLVYLKAVLLLHWPYSIY